MYVYHIIRFYSIPEGVRGARPAPGAFLSGPFPPAPGLSVLFALFVFFVFFVLSDFSLVRKKMPESSAPTPRHPWRLSPRTPPEGRKMQPTLADGFECPQGAPQGGGANAEGTLSNR